MMLAPAEMRTWARFYCTIAGEANCNGCPTFYFWGADGVPAGGCCELGKGFDSWDCIWT